MKKTLWVWIAIVILLGAAAAIWRMVTPQEEYLKTDRARVQLEMLGTALKGYASRHGKFPTTEEGLMVLAKEGDVKASAFTDLWGRPMQYRCVASDCKAVVLKSQGDSATATDSSEISLTIEQR